MPREQVRVREVRAELGAALRDARVRRSLDAAVRATPAIRPLVRPRPLWRAFAAAVAATVVLSAIALWPIEQGDGPADGEPAAVAPGGAIAEPLLSRGRSRDQIPLVLGPPEASAEPAPGSPEPTRGTRRGSGSGGTGRTTIVTETRFYGRVVDARTGRGVPDVCIVIGNRTCDENPARTDRDGEFSIRLPAPGTWDLNFAKTGYVTAYRQASSSNTQASVNVGTIRLPPRT